MQTFAAGCYSCFVSCWSLCFVFVISSSFFRFLFFSIALCLVLFQPSQTITCCKEEIASKHLFCLLFNVSVHNRIAHTLLLLYARVCELTTHSHIHTISNTNVYRLWNHRHWNTWTNAYPDGRRFKCIYTLL